MDPLKPLQNLQKSNFTARIKALDNLDFSNPLDLLMELAVLFEERFAEETELVNIQIGGVTLSKLLKDIFRKQPFQMLEGTAEEQQVKLLECTIKVHKQGVDPGLNQLFQLYETERSLNEWAQIHKYDRFCEVVWYEEGCTKTRIKNFAGLQAYRRDGLKYEYLAKYYANKGRWDAFEKLKNQRISLQGKNEEDQVDSFNHIAEQIAAQSYLQHYGVEEKFKLNGKIYQTLLLVQLLSFIISYTQSRYGRFWEEQQDELNVIKRIFKVWQSNITQEGRETPGPLFISTWADLLGRFQQVMGNRWSKEDLVQHLSIFVGVLETPIEELNIQETPFLRIGEWALYFARPLMLQNSWIPILKPLVKAINGVQPEGAQGRNKRSTVWFSERFIKHGFTVIADVNLICPKTLQQVTDVDVFALKGNYLFLIQIKMTFPATGQKEARSHRDTALKKASKQTQKSLIYFENNWPYFCQQHSDKGIPGNLSWDKLEVVPLIVSTSFEWDRDPTLGYPKISQFELERYLDNDVFYLHLVPEKEFGWPNFEEEYLLYPKTEHLSGEKLKTLIEENALWSFLEPAVLAKPLINLLPGYCEANSPASQAEEYFIKGNERFQSGHYEKATSQYRLAIQLFSYDEEYYKGLGNALAMQGKRRSSLEFFDKAIELNPFFGEAYNARGLTYRELHEYDKAYHDLLQATVYSPYDLTSWKDLAQLQIYRGEKWALKQLIEEGVRFAITGLNIYKKLNMHAQLESKSIALDLTALIASYRIDR